MERLYRFGNCQRCVCIAHLHTLLGDDSGIIDRLEPVFTALVRSDADSTLNYLEYRGGYQLLKQLREDGRPITHELLDEFRAQRALRPLRDALVCAGLLEPRDEILCALTEKLDETLATIADSDEQRLLRSYTNWRLLRRLRAQSGTRPLTQAQAVYARSKLNRAIGLLEVAHQLGGRLEDLTQHDIDEWQARDRSANLARDFVSWATERHHCRRGLVVAAHPRPQPPSGISDDHRWHLVRSLLHDTTIDRCDRFAGLLLLLFAQPAGRVVRLRTDAISQRIDGRHVCLALGSEPIELPPPLDELALDLVVNRYRGRAALARVTDHDWLFPGLRAGTPMSSHHLNGRLKRLGISAQTARNTALMDLASHLPAAVLSALLGLDVVTAQGWIAEVGQRRSYAAALAQRTTNHPTTTPFTSEGSHR
ncbi:hypothetical protein [Nocardia puris]|uniref:hypothetical protein n=1 Tax=Nocardia puris TaxID=208602 RepID=UPI00083293D4|nr:hypothetical protein [Nocardia puris]